VITQTCRGLTSSSSKRIRRADISSRTGSSQAGSSPRNFVASRSAPDGVIVVITWKESSCTLMFRSDTISPAPSGGVNNLGYEVWPSPKGAQQPEGGGVASPKGAQQPEGGPGAANAALGSGVASPIVRSGCSTTCVECDRHGRAAPPWTVSRHEGHEGASRPGRGAGSYREY